MELNRHPRERGFHQSRSGQHSLPEATTYETGAHGIARREWDDLDLVTNWRFYLNEPGRYRRHILTP